jgi:hemoglobin/transferrin/lactoferrin receptor protein
VLAKLVYQPNADQSHMLTVERRSQSTYVNNLHDFANGTTKSHTDDNESTRNRVSLKSDFRLNAAAADLLTGYPGLAGQQFHPEAGCGYHHPGPARARPQL